MEDYLTQVFIHIINTGIRQQSAAIWAVYHGSYMDCRGNFFFPLWNCFCHIPKKQTSHQCL